MRRKQIIKSWQLFSLFTIVFSSLVLFACDDIFSEDISDVTVRLFSPSDGSIVRENSVTFQWDSVAGAIEYQFVLGTPSFDNLEQVEIDSFVTRSSLKLFLEPGMYQWKITASNNAYFSVSDTFSFAIDTLVDIGANSVELLSPNDGKYLNVTEVDFFWSKLELADDYRFEIRSDQENGQLVHAGIVDSLTFSYDLKQEGVFYWGVQAQKQFQQPSSFTYFNVNIDTTSPSTPSLSEPSDQSLVSEFPLNFTWQKSNNEEFSPEFDSVFIFRTNNFDTLIIESTRVSNTMSYVVDTLMQGNYFWTVRSFDVAGNSSFEASANSFIVP